MNFRILVAAAFLIAAPSVLIGGTDPRFESRPSKPGEFPAMPSCHLEYVFGWSDVLEAARATVDFFTDPSESRAVVLGGTTGPVRLLWRMDARHDAIIDPVTLRGLWFEQYEQYRTGNIETRVAFPDRGGVMRFRRVNPDPRLTAKWKKVRLDGVFDVLGGIAFARSQPLENGDKLQIIGFPGDSPYQVNLKVEKRETITIMDRPMRAIRMSIRIKKIETEKGRPTGLANHSKFRSGTVWISDDAIRIPLRAEMKIFIGSVTGELVSMKIF